MADDDDLTLELARVGLGAVSPEELHCSMRSDPSSSRQPTSRTEPMARSGSGGSRSCSHRRSSRSRRSSSSS